MLRELGSSARRAIFRQLLPTIGYLQEEQLQELLEKAATLADLLKKLSALGGASAIGLRAAFDRTFSDPGFYSTGFDLTTLGTAPLRIDLSELSRPAQPLAVSLLLLLLFERLRGAGPTTKPGLLRSFVILDEAAILRNESIIDTLAREARKFGLGAAIASQSVRDLSGDVLGNAATTCCFRLLTKPEAALVEKSVPGMQAATLNALRAPGEALIRDRNGVQRVQMARALTGKKR